MVLSLGELQEIFTHNYALLILHAERLGFKVRTGETARGKEQAEYNATHCAKCRKSISSHSTEIHKFKPLGIRGSLHCLGLAGDVKLFSVDSQGKRHYIKDSAAYKPLGDYWKSLHPLACWGGEFGDGGHFSITYKGRK